jgi:gamma-glutamylcyclotransferase
MSGRIWYFAYGSNMQSATFCGRRRIECMRAVAARVPGWRIVFDKPPIVPVGESFANIVPDATAEVMGVLYEIGADDHEHIELTEGVLIDNYRRVVVAAVSLDGTLAVDAFSLATDQHAPDLLPSTRYMACIVAGAEEHGLPADYVAMLRRIPARVETPAAAAMRPVLDAVMGERRRSGDEGED